MSFLAGARVGAPLLVAMFPIGLATGVICRSAGFTVGEVGLMALLAYAGAAQIVMSSLFAAGAAAPAMIWATTLVNARFLLFSTALVPNLRHLKAWQNALLGHTLTDPSFAIIAGTWQGRPANPWWVAGLHLGPYVVWTAGVWAGAAAGQLLDANLLRTLGLDFAMPATFIGLLVPDLIGPGRGDRWLAAAVAGAAGVALALLLPGNLYMIVGSLAGATVGVLWR